MTVNELKIAIKMLKELHKKVKTKTFEEEIESVTELCEGILNSFNKTDTLRLEKE